MLREKVFFFLFCFLLRSTKELALWGLHFSDLNLIWFLFHSMGGDTNPWVAGGGVGGCIRNRVKIYQIKYLELHSTMTSCDSMSSWKQFFTSPPKLIDSNDICSDIILDVSPPLRCVSTHIPVNSLEGTHHFCLIEIHTRLKDAPPHNYVHVNSYLKFMLVPCTLI